MLWIRFLHKRNWGQTCCGSINTCPSPGGWVVQSLQKLTKGRQASSDRNWGLREDYFKRDWETKEITTRPESLKGNRIISKKMWNWDSIIVWSLLRKERKEVVEAGCSAGSSPMKGDAALGSKEKWKSLSCVWLFATPRTVAFMEFSRPEY